MVGVVGGHGFVSQPVELGALGEVGVVVPGAVGEAGTAGVVWNNEIKLKSLFFKHFEAVLNQGDIQDIYN